MPKTASEWNDAISSRRKTLKSDWLDKADEIVDIYESENKDKVPFNILYSNTETMLPAMYNSTPRPDVSRRYTSINIDKQLDTAVASSSERLLEYFSDSNDQEYETFGEATQFAVLQALVPGQGQVRIRYKTEGNYQHVCYDSVIYDRFVWAYARKWCDVPWVAFGVDLLKVDFEKQFPDFIKKKVYKEFSWEAMEREGLEYRDTRTKDDEKKYPTLLIWEIWSPADKKINFVSDKFKDEILLDADYPFDLTSRFPCPAPLKFIRRAKNLTPKPPYELYERQAEELNELTNRLKIVVKAIKWRGAYNSQLKEFAQVFDTDDTGFVPVEDVGSFTEAGGFEKNVWVMPLELLINTAREISLQRDAVKGTIYEIMGIGDILRGESKPSETAAAQEIKNQWGTLRIKRMQRDVQNFCRDVFRITLEYAANLFTPATFAAITKLPYPTEQQKAEAAQGMAQKQAQAQQMQQAGQQPPQLSSADQEMMVAAQSVTWEQITQIMRDKFERTYRIDIETNSTVDLEATEDKAAIAEFMNAWGQMMSGIVPLVESGAMPFDVAKIIMGEIFRRFRFAHKVEQALDLIQQPQPKEDPKIVQAKHDAEMAKVKADGATQISNMQQSLTRQQGEIEQIQVQLQEYKSGTNLMQKEQALGQKEQGLAQRETDVKGQAMQLDHKTQQLATKQDYAGKMQMAKEQNAKANENVAVAKLQGMIKDLQTAAQQFQDQKKQQEQAKQQQDTGVSEALTKLADGQQALMQAMAQIGQIVAADRESELVVGKDGTKKARSRVVMQ